MAGGIVYKDDPLGWNSVNQAALALLEGKAKVKPGPAYDPERRTNIKHRIWASSLSVLHLAMPLIWIGGLVAARASQTPTKVLERLLFQCNWVEYAIRLAEQEFKPLLANKIPTFNAEKAIRLLPTKDLIDSYLLLPEDFQQQP
jgi:hypothetical protein